MSDFLLSIIIPTYNASNTIVSAIDSILCQTFQQYEILIIDGLSTDNTIDIIKKYQKENDCIQWISGKDEGIYDAMNKGIRLAKGDWLYFLGADDTLYDSNTLESIFNGKSIEHFDLIYGNVSIVGTTTWAKDGDIYDGVFNLEKFISKNICHQAIFYRRTLQETVGFYNKDYKLCADWDFNIRCWAKTKFKYLDVLVAKFNAGGASTKSNSDDNFSKDFLNNLFTYLKLSPFHPAINKPSFLYFDQVLKFQQKENYLKYLLVRMNSKVHSIFKR